MGYIDIHCHVLPHVDDGAQNMDETLEMLRIAEQNGIECMVVTPHYKQGHVGIPREKVGELIDTVMQEAALAGIHIQLYPGTEIYYNSSLVEKFESGWLSTMNDSDYVLVEFSPFETFPYIRNAIDDIFSLGYQPILAHVERYQCMLAKTENAEILHEMGCRIQVNAGSVAGDYGFKVKHYIGKLLKKRLVDYVGTDAHNTKNRKPAIQKCADVIYKKCDREYADDILFANAYRDFFLED